MLHASLYTHHCTHVHLCLTVIRLKNCIFYILMLIIMTLQVDSISLSIKASSLIDYTITYPLYMIPSGKSNICHQEIGEISTLLHTVYNWLHDSIVDLCLCVEGREFDFLPLHSCILIGTQHYRDRTIFCVGKTLTRDPMYTPGILKNQMALSKKSNILYLGVSIFHSFLSFHRLT